MVSTVVPTRLNMFSTHSASSMPDTHEVNIWFGSCGEILAFEPIATLFQFVPTDKICQRNPHIAQTSWLCHHHFIVLHDLS